MPDALGPCPSSETLEGIAAGQDVAATLREHVAACPVCRDALQRIRDDNQFLASFRVRDAWPGAAPPASSSEIKIPGYDILRELYRGGQGVIFQAVQRSPRRDVAIKVMREGLFATTADRARFAREIETLGLLKHPNIVTVHDAGIAGGLHYFVMDYVDGLPLDEAVLGWSERPVRTDRTGPASASDSAASVPLAATHPNDRRAIGPDRLSATLKLFLKVCDAVHAAHLRGVMHRDLKPSNIRVDRSGDPHVLDFGLAKSVEETDLSMTQTGHFVGSLPWASPEQVEGASSRIDLRTDVYSLGVILFQLLTGGLPFEIETNLRNTVDLILHREPPRPSTVAAAHGLRIDADLETIVLKCLSKERERRYQSAGELARDLRNYLAGEAIDARRDSAWYVLRKTAWRKRRVFGLVVVPMLLFPFVLYALHRTTLAIRQAELERNLRQVEAERTAAMLEIARRLQARPESATESPGGRLSIQNVHAIQNDLDAGSLSVSDHSVALLLAETLRDRGLIVEAEGLARRALYMLQCDRGPHHPEVGRMRVILADLLMRRGTRMNEAERTAERAVLELTEAFGETSPETARGWTVLARIRLARGDTAGALDAAQRALAADEDPRSIQHATTQATLARVRAERGENAESKRVFLEAIRAMLILTHDTDGRLLDTVDLGATMIEHGVLSSEELLDSSAWRGALADVNPHEALHEVVAVVRGGSDGTARDENALPARLAMVALRERLLGPEHPSLGTSLASAGEAIYEDAIAKGGLAPQRFQEAATVLHRAIPLQIAANGPDSPLVGKSYENLGTCMVTLGRLHEATQWFARDTELWMRQPPELRDDYQSLIRSRWTAWHATRAGDYELGLEWTDRSLELLGRTLGPEDGGAALIHACRALCLASLKRFAEAQASDALAVRLLDAQPVPDDQRIECGRLLGLTRLLLDKPEEARAVMEPAWQAARPRFEREHYGAYRLEWSRTMLQYCRGIGDHSRAEPFARCIREEATGDFRVEEAALKEPVPGY